MGSFAFHPLRRAHKKRRYALRGRVQVIAGRLNFPPLPLNEKNQWMADMMCCTHNLNGNTSSQRYESQALPE
jgi:hypothetical protein